MTQAAEKIISRLDRRRKGTKTFLDISKEERLRDFRESEAGMFLRSTVPAEIRDLMKKVLLNGTDCPEAENLKRFFLLGEENGQPFSVINKMIDFVNKTNFVIYLSKWVKIIAQTLVIWHTQEINP